MNLVAKVGLSVGIGALLLVLGALITPISATATLFTPEFSQTPGFRAFMGGSSERLDYHEVDCKTIVSAPDSQYCGNITLTSYAGLVSIARANQVVPDNPYIQNLPAPVMRPNCGLPILTGYRSNCGAPLTVFPDAASLTTSPLAFITITFAWLIAGTASFLALSWLQRFIRLPK